MSKTVEPKRVRQAAVIRYLRGRPACTIKEVARTMKVGYYTAQRLLKELYNNGLVELSDVDTKPYKYYVSLRNKL
jgi:DNA-binding IclR family transcriptional regulator